MNSTSTVTASGGPAGDPNIPIDYRPESRVEPIPRPDFHHRDYPRWIGHKFAPSGTVLPYPGNTVLAQLDPHSPLHRALCTMLADFQAQPFASLLTFLPASSLHMTIYEGVTDGIRRRDSYPGDLSLDSSLRTCHAHLAERLADFPHALGPHGVGRMKVVGYEPIADGIGLKLEAATPETESRLRSLRDRLSKELKMRHPGHDSYSWHMALAYTVRHLSATDQACISRYLAEWQERLPATFDLGVPEFCVYDDMHQFRRVYFLR